MFELVQFQDTPMLDFRVVALQAARALVQAVAIEVQQSKPGIDGLPKHRFFLNVERRLWVIVKPAHQFIIVLLGSDGYGRDRSGRRGPPGRAHDSGQVSIVRQSSLVAAIDIHHIDVIAAPAYGGKDNPLAVG